jgi:hypothetical protein
MAERLAIQLQPNGLQQSLHTGLLPFGTSETEEDLLLPASIFADYYLLGSLDAGTGAMWVLAA